jgi:hypothetical protein
LTFFHQRRFTHNATPNLVGLQAVCGDLPNHPPVGAQDLQDAIDFYHLPFRQIRSGETKKRILRIPEY